MAYFLQDGRRRGYCLWPDVSQTPERLSVDARVGVVDGLLQRGDGFERLSADVRQRSQPPLSDRLIGFRREQANHRGHRGLGFEADLAEAEKGLDPRVIGGERPAQAILSLHGAWQVFPAFEFRHVPQRIAVAQGVDQVGKRLVESQFERCGGDALRCLHFDEPAEFLALVNRLFVRSTARPSDGESEH